VRKILGRAGGGVTVARSEYVLRIVCGEEHDLAAVMAACFSGLADRGIEAWVGQSADIRDEIGKLKSTGEVLAKSVWELRKALADSEKKVVDLSSKLAALESGDS